MLCVYASLDRGVCVHEYVCACESMCVCAHVCYHAFMFIYVCARAFCLSSFTKTAPLGKRDKIKISFFKNIFDIVHARVLRNVSIIIHLNNYRNLIIV